MKNLVFIIYCYIFVVSLSQILCSSEKTDTRFNISTAILAELADNYGSEGTLDKDQLHSLIEDVIGVEKDVDGSLNNTDVEDIKHACLVGNLTSCKDALDSKCLDSQTLTDIYAADWTSVFPALVYRRVSNSCLDTGADEITHRRGHVKPSSAAAWGYGLGFAFLIVVISNIGGCMVPFRKRRFFHRMLMFCVALAVGTLAGTGFMVLIPESMHLTGEDSPVPDYHFKLATALGGIYFFYMSERLLKIFMKRNKKQKGKEVSLMKPVGPVDGHKPMLENGGHSHIQDDVDFTDFDIKERENGEKPKVNSVAWLVLLGDALHNFVDGMSIGAGFTENVYTGISVSLAVLCEELPHELGDVAILHHAGLSMKRALLYNFIAALTVLVGLVVGIVLGENTEANTWIFASAGGMFIYISLVDILPEMGEQAKRTIEKGIETPVSSFIIQNVGLVGGFCIILCLAMFGKYIQV